MASPTAVSVPGSIGTHFVALPPAKLPMGSKTTSFIPRLTASALSLAFVMAECPEPVPLLEPHFSTNCVYLQSGEIDQAP